MVVAHSPRANPGPRNFGFERLGPGCLSSCGCGIFFKWASASMGLVLVTHRILIRNLLSRTCVMRSQIASVTDTYTLKLGKSISNTCAKQNTCACVINRNNLGTTGEQPGNNGGTTGGNGEQRGEIGEQRGNHGVWHTGKENAKHCSHSWVACTLDTSHLAVL